MPSLYQMVMSLPIPNGDLPFSNAEPQSAPMSDAPAPTSAADNRRRRLRQWIDDHFGGSQSAFISSTNDGNRQLNQGELSALLKTKSFGERRARSLEEQSGMPRMYLDTADTPPTGYTTTANEPAASSPAPLAKPLVWPFKGVSYKRLSELRQSLGPKLGQEALNDIDKHLEIVVMKWEHEVIARKRSSR